MCVILDTNTFGLFRDPKNEEFEPVRKWLDNQNGRIVYSNSEKYKTEWRKGGMENWVKERSRAGQYRLISDGVEEKEKELKGKIQSDDEHIIALALIANIKVLISYSEYTNRQKGDSDLMRDFRDKRLVGGKVYTRKEHKHLLKSGLCPD